MFAQILFLMIFQAVNERIYGGNNRAKERKTRHAINVRNLKEMKTDLQPAKFISIFGLRVQKVKDRQ